MAETRAGATFPVLFFDGETEIDIGDVSVHPFLDFKAFQSVLSHKIGISPHQISVYLDCPKKSRSYPGRRRRIPITAKINFAAIARERDCFFLVVLKRSRRERRHKRSGSREEESDAVYAPPTAPEKLMILRRSDQIPTMSSPFYDPVASFDLQIQREKYLMAMRDSYPCARRTDPLVCDYCCNAKEEGGGTAPFHWCVYDAVTVGFRSPAGPIARPVKSFD